MKTKLMLEKEKIDIFLNKNFKEIEEKRHSTGFSWKKIKKEIGVEKATTEAIRFRFRKLRLKRGLIVEKKEEKFSSISGKEDLSKGTKEFSFTADKIPTEKEILEHFNIDTKKFKISQIWHKTSFGGKYSISVSLLANNTSGIDYEAAFKRFLSRVEINNFPKINNSISIDYKPFNQKTTALITLADLHIGNHQIKNYIDNIKSNFEILLNSSIHYGANEVIILNTGDILHTDNIKNQTTSGTQLDAASSQEDAFVEALDLICDLINRSLEYENLKVTFVNVRGNHSYNSEYMLGEALKRIFIKNKNITILNSKENRIYYSSNNNSFLFTHGDKAFDKLPMIFTTEGKEIYAKNDFHHIVVGHLHHNKSKQFVDDTGEYFGLDVRVVGSPTSTDRWHKNEGFILNQKNIYCFLYDDLQGKSAEFIKKI